MSYELSKFTKNYKTKDQKKGPKKEDSATHTIIPDLSATPKIYGGSYVITTDEQLLEFHQKYWNSCNAGKACANGDRYKPHQYTEAQYCNEDDHKCCIYVDLDFHRNMNPDGSVPARNWGPKHLQKIMDSYAFHLKNICKFRDGQMINMYVTYRNDPYQKLGTDIAKDGIHIVMDVLLPRELRLELRTLVMNEIGSLLVSELQLINNPESIWDEGISKGSTNTQLFLSNKPHYLPYTYRGCWEATYEENDDSMHVRRPFYMNLTFEIFRAMSVRVLDNKKKFTYHEEYAKMVKSAQGNITTQCEKRKMKEHNASSVALSKKTRIDGDTTSACESYTTAFDSSDDDDTGKYMDLITYGIGNKFGNAFYWQRLCGWFKRYKTINDWLIHIDSSHHSEAHEMWEMRSKVTMSSTHANLIGLAKDICPAYYAKWNDKHYPKGAPPTVLKSGECSIINPAAIKEVATAKPSGKTQTDFKCLLDTCKLIANKYIEKDSKNDKYKEIITSLKNQEGGREVALKLQTRSERTIEEFEEIWEATETETETETEPVYKQIAKQCDAEEFAAVIAKYAPKESNEIRGMSTDMEAALTLLKQYPHWKYCEGALYVFDKDHGVWGKDEVLHQKVAMQFDTYLHLLIKDKEGKTMVRDPIHSYVNNASRLCKLIKMLQPLCIDQNWLKYNANSSLKYILFNNGYYDMRTRKFLNKDETKGLTNGFNPDIVFFSKIHDDYKELTAKEKTYATSIRNQLFIEPLNEETGSHLILQFARALAGDCQKKIVFGLGVSGSGKGGITSSLKYSLYDYFDEFNGESLAHTRGTQDAASKLRWAYLMRYARVAVCNELDAETKLSAPLIKAIASGGDGMKGRGMCENDTRFQPHFGVFCFANDMPPISSYEAGVNNRLDAISFCKERVLNATKGSDFELEIDPTLPSRQKTKRFQRCLRQVLFDAYAQFIEGGCIETTPSTSAENKDEWVDNSMFNADAFLDEYELTDVDTDYVSTEDITEWLAYNHFEINIKKMIFILKPHVYKMVNFKAAQITVDGVRIGIRRGMKQRPLPRTCLIRHAAH